MAALQPDFSDLSFEECAALLKSVANVHFSGPEDILYYTMQPIWSQVLDRLRAFNDKRYDRVVDAAINGADRKRLRHIPDRRRDGKVIQLSSSASRIRAAALPDTAA